MKPDVVISILGGIASIAALGAAVLGYATMSAQIVITMAASAWVLLAMFQFLRFAANAQRARILRMRSISYDARKRSIEHILGELEEQMGLSPQNHEKILRELGFCMNEILCLAATITDNPDHALTSNLMEYVTSDANLSISRVFGPYPLWRMRRIFVPGNPDHEGSCGRAFRTGEIITVPDTAKSSSIYWEFPTEKSELRGVINIPVPVQDHSERVIAVLNIDSPTPNTLTEARCFTRAREIQRLTVRALTLRRDFVGVDR